MWQSFGFAVQLLMNIYVDDLMIQLGVLAGVLLVALACMAYLDRNVQPFDTAKAVTRKHEHASSEGSQSLLRD